MTGTNIKKLAQGLYAQHINDVAKRFKPDTILEGHWISAVRQALGMSAAQLARRMGKSRALLSQQEKAEADGAITLATMKDIAAAMNCRFVYAIVPQDSIEATLREQAHKHASHRLHKAGTHMALEDQTLSHKARTKEIERLTKQLLQDRPRSLWEVEE